MNERKVENIKVFFRERPILYKIALILYTPVRVVENLKKRIRIKKDVAELLTRLNRLDGTKKRVFFCGIPVCENLGDVAMMICIRQWIEEHFAGYDIFEMKTYPTYHKKVREKLKNCVKKEDIFITQSGALFCNRHQDHGMHRYLLATFPDNRILFMPVTVDLTDAGELQKTAELFNRHKHSLLLTRDHVSYEMIHEEFDSKRIRVYPDIVTTMIGRESEEVSGRNGILVCKRIDGEKCYTDKGIEDFLRRLRKLSPKVDITDTTFERSYEDTMSHGMEEIERKIKKFAAYKIIVTDRFHGMIFALIANTPVIILPTKGQKVKEGARWFGEFYSNSLFFCETLEEAEEKIKYMLDKDMKIQNQSIVKELYYDNRLKEEFDMITL